MNTTHLGAWIDSGAFGDDSTAVSVVELKNARGRAYADSSSSIEAGEERLSRMFLGLNQAIDEASVDASVPLEVASLRKAWERGAELLAALPSSIPLPAIAVDPDHDVQLEWIRGRRWRIALSLDRRGMLNFAAIRGTAVLYGEDSFAGAIPPVVWPLLRDVLQHVAG